MRPSNPPANERYNEFVRLLTQNERRVYAFIVSQVTDWNDADDIQQETNVRLWEQFDRFQAGTDFGAWACTVAQYQILTHRRTKMRSKLVFSDGFIEMIQAQQPVKADLFESRRAALKGCIDQLGESARQILRASYEPHVKIRDVAKRIGRSPQATSKALQRIRYALHQCIEKRVAAEGRR